MLRRLVSFVAAIVLWPVCVAEHRRVLAELAAMDDRGLADIGLRRQDLRDVTALPLSADPTAALAQRARERERLARTARRAAKPISHRIAAE
jgi:uncharacterized protein YjiS (DUF1127 family)